MIIYSTSQNAYYTTGKGVYVVRHNKDNQIEIDCSNWHKKWWLLLTDDEVITVNTYKGDNLLQSHVVDYITQLGEMLKYPAAVINFVFAHLRKETTT